MNETLLDIARYAQVALGIGLVIFVHELGHFLTARWCGVRVETFSLGFGPKVLGWTRGPTLYQIALVPLGGYVKMAGEDARADGREPRADELPAKSVGQRFLIYSGGVIMNVIFALVVFPILLMAGVTFEEPLIGSSEPGSPAWHAGLEPGTRVVSVNGNDVYTFMHIPNEVALGPNDESVLVVEGPGPKPRRTVRVVPLASERIGANSIGVRPAADPLGRIEVVPGTAAADAGLRSGDRLVSVVGVPPGLTLEEQLAFASRRGAPVRARLERDGAEFEALVEPKPHAASKTPILGVSLAIDTVADVREGPLSDQLALRKGDRVVSIDGAPVYRPYDVLAALSTATTPRVRIERDGSNLDLEGPALAPGDAVALYQAIAFGPSKAVRVVVSPGSAAEEAGLRSGDVITRVGDRDVATFDDISQAVAKSGKDAPLDVRVERAGATDGGLAFAIQPRAAPPPDYGFGLRDAQYVYKANGPLEAVVVGFHSSWKLVKESFLTLQRIANGDVSGKNVGGIITIGVVSHSWAEVGWTRLFFFLCMLSMNLAFLNVLPVPVLDGGHLFFLIVEKIKGSPVSENVMGFSQMVGVVLLVSLMVYVTFNDVVRWIVQ